MKAYNRSLDFVTLAMAKARGGDATTAAKLFAKAIKAPDAMRAIAILEASNKQAYANKTTAAKKRVVKATEDEFDMADIDDLADDDTEVEAHDMEEEEDDG